MRKGPCVFPGRFRAASGRRSTGTRRYHAAMRERRGTYRLAPIGLAAGRALVEAAAETLWPTRCALCDRPGAVLCGACAQALDFIDYYQACPACGAPWGRIQCDHCAAARLRAQEEAETLADGMRAGFAMPAGGVHDVAPDAGAGPRPCIGCLRYTPSTATLVKTYKDKGEQRLAGVIAALMADAAPPSWRGWAECVTYITATKAARARRGFDHAGLIATELARIWGVPSMRLLDAPAAADQRTLGRRGRIGNMAGRFAAATVAMPARAVVVDDVLTTGATMGDACAALETAGCRCRCLVAARV